MQVRAEDVGSFLNQIRKVGNVDGVIATIPHKQAVCERASERGPLALATEAANVLKPIGKSEWAAEIFDGYGSVEAFRRRGIDRSGKRVLIIGAGGAGAALAVAFRKLTEVGRMRIADIDSERAKALAARVGNAETGLPDPADFQIVINATPFGMGSDETPVDSSLLSRDTIVSDALIKPAKTRLLKEAEAMGCQIVCGGEMLEWQGGSIMRYWGVAPRREQNVKW